MKHLTLNSNYCDAYTIVAKYISKGYLCHGGPEEFNEFDPKFIQGGSRGEYGYGFYFCNEAYKPINYGNQMYFVKENTFNLCNLNTNENPLEELEDLQYKAEIGINNARNIREYDYYSELKDRLKLNFEEENYLIFFNKGFREGYGAKNALKYALNYVPGNFNPKNLANLFVKLGYDGIIAENQYVIFNIPKLNQNLLEITLDDDNNPIVPESKTMNIDRIITESINKFVNEIAVKQFTPYDTEKDRPENFAPFTNNSVRFTGDDTYNQKMIELAKKGNRGAIRHCKNNRLKF